MFDHVANGAWPTPTLIPSPQGGGRRWGDGQWHNVKLQPGYQNWICWAYDNPQKSSPNLTFQIDVDATGGQAWTTYTLTRVQTAGAHCKNVGKGGHYDIGYRPNTNNTFLQVTKRN